jgi:hypothetical protein
MSGGVVGALGEDGADGEAAFAAAAGAEEPSPVVSAFEAKAEGAFGPPGPITEGEPCVGPAGAAVKPGLTPSTEG